MKSGTAVNNVITNAAIIAVRRIDTHNFCVFECISYAGLKVTNEPTPLTNMIRTSISVIIFNMFPPI